jgi:hypothetical protein
LLSGFAHLDPGGPANLVEEVPVNVVFVGYEPDLIDEADFRRWLPTHHDPVVLARRQFGIHEEVGVHYTYDFELTYTDAAFEDAFFGKLGELAVPQTGPRPRSLYQEVYNQQALSTVEVTVNHLIDAPSVEKWLAANPPPGVDTTENTIFYVNWWGRSDFKFHVYTDTHDSDPDTGTNHGLYEPTWRLAFGGTTQADDETGLGELGTHRIWVHDLSAGPDAMTGNWDIDHMDMNGDGATDARLAPVWDYLTLFPGTIGWDLGVLTRFVAVDSIFTASPWAPPYLTFPEMPASVNLDLNVYEGWRGVDASATALRPEVILGEVNELYRVSMTVDVQDLRYEGDASAGFEKFLLGLPHHTEAGNDDPWANPFYQEALHLDERLDGGGEYEAVTAIYALDDHEQGGWGIGGYEDTNYQDGTQSFGFGFVSPLALEYGRLGTQVTIHEYGHHFGLIHPHEGYDTEFDGHYSPGWPGLDFMWTGTEVNSVMSYNNLNNDFGQFDHDNFNRFWAAGYIRSTNAIAADVLASPNAAAALPHLAAADAEVGLAAAAMAAHDYVSTFDHAKRAYEHVRAGAAAAGVPVEGTQIGRTVPDRPPGRRTTPVWIPSGKGLLGDLVDRIAAPEVVPGDAIHGNVPAPELVAGTAQGTAGAAAGAANRNGEPTAPPHVPAGFGPPMLLLGGLVAPSGLGRGTAGILFGTAAETDHVRGPSAVESGDSEDRAAAHGREALLRLSASDEAQGRTGSQEGDRPGPAIGTAVARAEYPWYLDLDGDRGDLDAGRFNRPFPGL